MDELFSCLLQYAQKKGDSWANIVQQAKIAFDTESYHLYLLAGDNPGDLPAIIEAIVVIGFIETEGFAVGHACSPNSPLTKEKDEYYAISKVKEAVKNLPSTGEVAIVGRSISDSIFIAALTLHKFTSGSFVALWSPFRKEEIAPLIRNTIEKRYS